MTNYATFALSFAAFLCLLAVVAAWVFRTSAAPLLAKMAIPVLLVIVAIETPYAVASMMGFPTTITPPDQAELIAFLPHDEDGRVDLWMRSGPQPRVYDVPLDDKLKKTLRDAHDRQGAGQRVMLHRGKLRPPGVQDTPSPAPAFEIDDSAFRLPEKQ